MAFNLADMINKRPVQSTKTENISDTVYRDVFELIPSRENFYSTDPEKLQGLKNSILLFGVLQDVLIEDVDGKDRIISGHCRTMCCRMLVEEGHEEFRKINCKYTKVNLNTEELPDDGEGKVDQLLNKLVVIQANRFREKSDWEKMQEALVTEKVIKELRELVDLQGTTRNMVQATLGISGTQLERYHAIQKKLSSELMEEYKAAKINISVARELADLDEVHQKEALELYNTNGVLTLPDAKTLKEKQEVTRQIPGQLTLAETVGQRRPPEDDTVIDVEVQITRFFESLRKPTTERIYKQDKNMTIYMLSTIYNSVRIRNGHLNYQGKTNGILFNPASEQEKMISWQQLAETLIAKYGKKQKTVKVAPLPETEECPRYDMDEVTNSWSEWDPQEAVKEFCARYPERLKEIMKICREYKNNGDRAKETQKKFAPYGFSAHANGDFDYKFEELSGGVTFESAAKKKKIQMKYGRLIVEMLNLYDPYSPEFDLPEEKTDMSESDMSECCQQAAEKTDERQQEPEKEGTSPDVNYEIPEVWPPELKDIPVPSMIAMDDILQDAEEDLKNFLSIADQGLPGRTLLKYQLITGGLRIIKNLVKDCLDDENKDNGKKIMEQLPLPVLRNNDQRKEWLRNYKAWGLWYTDEHIGVRYYKYDFANGARLIAEEYDPDNVHSQWVSDRTESYYMHLIGGPEPERASGIPKWTQHGRYNKFPNSESELVEFLKEMQRESK